MSGNDKDDRHRHPATEVLTKGFDPRLSVGSARPAVFRSSTYVFSSPEAAERAFEIAGGRAHLAPGEHVELIYSRINHPNAQITEERIVPLEKDATKALVFNSGMAAIMTALMSCLKPGDAIVYTIPIYGGTRHLIQDLLTPWGIASIPVLAGQTHKLDEAIRSTPNLKVILIETPANPTLLMTDIRHAVDTAHTLRDKPYVMVDNTLLGPTFQHPLALGADLVLYSATKYLGGMSDLLAGVAIARDPGLIERMRIHRIFFGNILQPDECWILDTRLPTVTLRMNRASKNAQRIAERLAGHPAIAKVIYPSLFTDPDQIRIRLAQCDYPGAMFALDLKGGKKAAFDFLRNLKITHNAVSLGGVESLACHPKTTTHSGFTEDESTAAGVTGSLVRISVGIEDWRDLLADFDQALNSC